MNPIQIRSAQFLSDMLDLIEAQSALRFGKNLPVSVLTEPVCISREGAVEGEAQESTQTQTPVHPIRQERVGEQSDSCGGQIPYLEHSTELELNRAGEWLDVLVEITDVVKGTAPWFDCNDPRYDGHEASAGRAWVVDYETLPVSVLAEPGNSEAVNGVVPIVGIGEARESTRGLTRQPEIVAQGNSRGRQFTFRQGQPIELTAQEKALAVDRFLEGK